VFLFSLMRHYTHILTAPEETDWQMEREKDESVALLGSSWRNKCDTLSVPLNDINECLTSYTERETAAICVTKTHSSYTLLKSMCVCKPVWKSRTFVGMSVLLPEFLTCCVSETKLSVSLSLHQIRCFCWKVRLLHQTLAELLVCCYFLKNLLF